LNLAHLYVLANDCTLAEGLFDLSVKKESNPKTAIPDPGVADTMPESAINLIQKQIQLSFVDDNVWIPKFSASRGNKTLYKMSGFQ
jgi:hypothetical protein